MGKNRYHKSGVAPGLDSEKTADPKIDLKRYRRVRWFFAKVFWQVLWWDLIFSVPILQWFRPPPLQRWQTVSRKYKEMAMEMGGVLIKLGQFLSARIDILPPEVTRELAGLQDEVAPEDFKKIRQQIEDDFGRTIGDVFAFFASEPMGSASLAQAHHAELQSGEEVVVKVLRPGIHLLVETDLTVMHLVCGWLKLFQYVRDRMDLDRLLEEFSATTRDELDLIKEGENIERFASDFKNDPHVYVPKIYKQHSAARSLTLENVSYIKIADTEAIEACGISCAKIAERLSDIYMKQIFVTNFVHVDPHPGNLFVKPLPHSEESKESECVPNEFSPGGKLPYRKDRPFQIVFIDFGMTAVIPERLRAALRMGAIGIGTRDANKIIQAYVMASMLQPGADLRRLEEAHDNWFKRIWGIRMGQIRKVAFKEAHRFLREYRDLITDTPFQFPTDLLFIGRALGILAGMTTQLDPDFDPWAQSIPYAKRFASEDSRAGLKGWPEEVVLLGQHILKIPVNLDQVLTKAKQGSLAVQVSLSPETRKAIKRIDLSVKRFSWMVLAAGLLLSGVNLHIAGSDPLLRIILIVLAVVTFLWGIKKG